MIKILFVCHGNICRSPMAEFIMKELCRENGIEDVYIESVATSREEIGCDMYPPAKRMLTQKGIPFSSRRARQMTRSDYESFDYIYYMDRNNKRNLFYIVDEDVDHKIQSLLPDRDISDPWYSDNFELAFNDIMEGCKLRFEEIFE